jgi:two-component system cell cycle sensor histidine kinase/response regulator CckA
VLAPGLGRVMADPGQLEQVLMNLAVNARDAMPQGGRLTIETRNVELDEEPARPIGVRAGSYVVLTVSDTGIGMDSTTKSHLFEPFFTTKPVGKGTGLGLATVYGIVRQADGYILVESELGRGATFKIYLPRVEAPADAPVERAPVEPPYGSETILVVEDEEEVRRLTGEVLQLQGYTVLEARHPGEALLIAERYQGPIHLLVTDVVLPQIGGRELADRLVRVRPDMKVFYVSGYTGDVGAHQATLHLGRAFLGKPFSPDALACKVREVLDGVASPVTRMLA